MIRYEIGTHLLTALKQTMATHISNHIHEWRWHCRLIKFWIPDQLLTDWFTTSFVSPIAGDIVMGACVTEEQAIACAQYLDLVYSQSNTLYDYFPDAPRPETSKLRQRPMLTVSSVLLILPLRNLQWTLGRKSRMLQMKIFLKVYPMLVLISRWMPSSPPW